MNSPFLQEFLKRQAMAAHPARKLPETKHAKGSAPATPVPSISVSKDIRELAADKPSVKKVQDWFMARIKELDAAAEAQ